MVFLELKALLEPFGINRYFTEGWGAYQRHLDPANHDTGKRCTMRKTLKKDIVYHGNTFTGLYRN